MSKTTLGLLAGVAAVGAWYWNRSRTTTSQPAVDRGTVIFDNTPTATPLSEEGVI
jgi:hypothetical protein